MIKSFAKLVKRGFGDGEFDNLILLLRCLLLMMAPYTLFLALLLTLDGEILFSAGAFLTLAFTIVAFVLTYRFPPASLLPVFGAYIDIFALTYAIHFGSEASFQLLIFINLFIIWYDISRSIFGKIFWSLVTGVAACYIHAVGSTVASQFFSEDLVYSLITYTNNIFCVIGLSLIAFFFCTQFADAERKLYLSNRELRKVSHTDPLTKLMNRRFAEEEFKEMEKNFGKNGNLITIALGDIDFFKKVNDTYGHDAGDLILSSLAAIFDGYMKEHGFVVRWGGEEFLFVFEHANGDEAYLVIDELRRHIEEGTYIYDNTPIKVTMTFGVEEYGPLTGMDAAIRDADRKLYLGKESGRNRVVF
ncbi:MAG: GGDEF domain-containing protein [Lachnospiraceae bacterium]|nr:GGDEF domain-containing protein [Lachnospiraceae bacterium]